MKVASVDFAYAHPVPGPVYLQLQGIKELLPMMLHGETWTLSLDLPADVYSYRFRIADMVSINDPRRSVHKRVGLETWSVVQVTEEGPVWVERAFPRLTGVEICRGISEAGMPLVGVEAIHAHEFPIFLWNQVDHLFQDALMHVFLVRPDRELAFGGEFMLEQDRSTAFGLKFWISVGLEPDMVMPGIWRFSVQVEGGPVVRKQFHLMA